MERVTRFVDPRKCDIETLKHNWIKEGWRIVLENGQSWILPDGTKEELYMVWLERKAS